MKIFALYSFGLVCIFLIFIDSTFVESFNVSKIFSLPSILLTISFAALCMLHTIFNALYARSKRLPLDQIVFLPSTLIPLLVIFLSVFPVLWSSTDKEYAISLMNKNYIDTALVLVLSSHTLLLLGLIFGKFIIPSRNASPKTDWRTERKLDKLFSSGVNSKILVLIILAFLVFPFKFGLRFDLILQGGRRYFLDSSLLQSLVPLAGILSTIFTILAGAYYGRSKKIITFLVPFIDMLPRIMSLSRGFFLPLIFFIAASSLLGGSLPGWFYLSIIPICVVCGAAALTARGLSSGGLSGISSGFGQAQADTFSSVQDFFQANSNIGILTHSVAFHDPSLDFITGFFRWVTTILPIPTFLAPADVPSVAKLLGITNAGVPMPVIGEIYFQMGWLGLVIFFLLGLWIGNLEGNIIWHTRNYGKAYWPHVMIWMSILYGFILSFHSASRGSSRVLFYSLAFIWTLEAFFSSDKRNKKYTIQESGNYPKYKS